MRKVAMDPDHIQIACMESFADTSSPKLYIAVLTAEQTPDRMEEIALTLSGGCSSNTSYLMRKAVFKRSSESYHSPHLTMFLLVLLPITNMAASVGKLILAGNLAKLNSTITFCELVEHGNMSDNALH